MTGSLTTGGAPFKGPKLGLPVLNRAQHEKLKAAERRLAGFEDAARDLVKLYDRGRMANLHHPVIAKFRALVQDRPKLEGKDK